MILIGQYDSPFVRRVGIALRLYGIAFEHKPWSTFSDAEKLRPYNPLTRVPTLVLDDGDVLMDSHLILDWLDGTVAPGRALFPRSEPERRRALRVAGIACSAGDKAVTLFYERRMHKEVSETWVARCRKQVAGGLALLEEDRRARSGPWWFGETMGHADIAVAAVIRFIREAHQNLFVDADHPALAAHAAAAEALPVFKEISQPFIPPA